MLKRSPCHLKIHSEIFIEEIMMFMICLKIFEVDVGEVGEGIGETKLDMSWWLSTLIDEYIGVPGTVFSTFLCVSNFQ